MEDKIIEILKQNKLYENTSSIDVKACCLLHEFFNTYTFNSTNHQKLPSNITRDDKGRIILDKIPFITSNKGHNNKWIILNNGTKLLIKGQRKKEYNLIELTLMYFFKQMNVNTANYDIAMLNGQEFLISISFLRNNERITNNYLSVPKISYIYEKEKEYKGQTHALKTIFLDRIYGNINRFTNNYGLIINDDKTPRICPLHSNAKEAMTFIRDDIHQNNLFPYIDKENDSSCNKVINYLLGYEEIMHWVNQVSKKASLPNAAERLYKEKNVYVDKETYRKMENFFSDSEKIVNSELVSKGKSFKIKLV